jgi:6-phosphogluconolactonase
MNNIFKFATEKELSLKAALFILSCIKEALEKQNCCSIILSGGSTPRNCYKNLAYLIKKYNIPLHALYWFFADERWVPPDHMHSNERMASKILLKPLHALPEHIFSWQALHNPPLICALNYERFILDFFIAHNRSPDICILGMGADGHTASLFPRATVLTENNKKHPLNKDIKKYAVAVMLPDHETCRLSLTPRILNKSRHVLFLIQGKTKSHAFVRLQIKDAHLPAAWIKSNDLSFFVTHDVLDS